MLTFQKAWGTQADPQTQLQTGVKEWDVTLKSFDIKVPSSPACRHLCKTALSSLNLV